jgi:hypothetical protein
MDFLTQRAVSPLPLQSATQHVFGEPVQESCYGRTKDRKVLHKIPYSSALTKAGAFYIEAIYHDRDTDITSTEPGRMDRIPYVRSKPR